MRFPGALSSVRYSLRFFDFDIAEVVVHLANPGDADARQVQIDPSYVDPAGATLRFQERDFLHPLLALLRSESG